MTQRVTRPIALDRSFNTTESTPRNIADVLAENLLAIKEAIENGGGGGSAASAAFICYYEDTSARQIQDAIDAGQIPYFYNNGVIAQLWKVETNKYTFRTSRTQTIDGEVYLSIIDYIVEGTHWSTETQTISGEGGGGGNTPYYNKTSSATPFDTTGRSGAQEIVYVMDVPTEGTYQVSVLLGITPKTANATKSDLTFQIVSDNSSRMENVFHAVVDDSETYAQQLSFSTTLLLKAGRTSLKLLCDELNTQYLVSVDDFTVAQMVSGIFQEGDSFDDVHNLTQTSTLNDDDGMLVDGATSGPRFMLWKTLANKILGLFGFHASSNPEYLYVITDVSDAFLFGIKRDGSVEWASGVPTPIRKVLELVTTRLDIQGAAIETKVDKEAGKSLVNSTFASGVSVVTNSEYLYAVTDSNGAFLFGIEHDGSVKWPKGIPAHIKSILDTLVSRLNIQGAAIENKVDKETGKALVDAVFANGVSVVTDEEYLFAVTDANGSVLFGAEKDGTFVWSKGIPGYIKAPLEKLLYEITTKVDKVAGKSLVNATFADGVRIDEDKEFMLAFTDNDGRFLFGIRKDGSVDWAKGIPQNIQNSLNALQQGLNGKQNAIPGKTVINSEFSDHVSSNDEDQEWFKVICDSVGKIVEGIRVTGEHVFMLPVQLNGGVDWTKDNLDDLSRALKENGFTGGTGDWSDNTSLEIPVPEMAIINFTNIDQMPQTKTTDAQAIMEFWDMNGNYFKKKVIANAQGSSSLSAPKKNIGIDICNDDWIGDDTFKIKFGAWVPQDSFHIKAYYTDFFKCVGLSGYDLVKKILDTRVPNTTWKKALNYGTDPVGQRNVSPQVDSGALCYPQGFLCKVYLNGVFEGLFCWQLKKHRDNYNLNKKTAENIHIEGMIGGTFFGGTIDWTAFEIRNPKDLITYTGEKYDGDNPTELIDSTSPAYDPTNSKHKLSAKVKQYIINLSNRMAQIGNDPSIFEQYFDVDSCVDYAILSDTIYNYDYVKNIQWTTWDGVKWFVNPYDLDSTLGANSAGDGIHYPSTSHVITATNHPVTFAINHYTSELEQRWEELRDAHIIDARAISENLEHYVRLFGKDGYQLEYDKWTNAPCNRDPMIDTDNWEMERDADGNPVIYTAQYHNWSNSTTYAQGDVVQYNLTGSSVGTFGWWFRFTAKQTNTNKPPITQRGFKDNIFRVYNWLNQQISNMDALYNYTQGG